MEDELRRKEALLRKPVRIDLEKAIGRGDDVCRYVVHL